MFAHDSIALTDLLDADMGPRLPAVVADQLVVAVVQLVATVDQIS